MHTGSSGVYTSLSVFTSYIALSPIRTFPLDSNNVTSTDSVAWKLLAL
jgi:hypothetical protein